MAPIHFAAAISALSFILPTVSAAAYDPAQAVCAVSTTTVYEYAGSKPSSKASSKSKDSTKSKASSKTPAKAVTVTSTSTQYTPPTGVAYPGVSFPSYSPKDPNPNGPFYNPNDYVPQPISWPGIPKKGQTVVPKLPTHNSNPGGPNKYKFNAPCWNAKGSDLKPALSQQETNGDSPWGLIDFPHLPPYLGPSGGSVSASATSSSWSSFKTLSSSWSSNSTTSFSVPTSSALVSISGNGSFSSFPTSFPTTSHSVLPTGLSSSSSKSSFNSSVSSSPFSDFSLGNSTNLTKAVACGKMPDSDVVRHYDFSVGTQVIAPDGVQKNGLVVNGAFPGPLIEANWGDWIEITVTNTLDEGTSLHWHGFLQTESPWFDGVPSVSQPPIAPGKSLTYKFRADMYGTTWYHSHYSAQYAGGALGPIVVHGPKTAEYDIDIGPVILSDWYHQDYFTIVNTTMNGGLPLSNNNLINGKMNYPCANTTFVCTPNAGISKFSFQSGKKYRLRLINTSAEGIQKFTIDGHQFTVIANDFVPINPYTTNVITLGVGQRSDVIVEAVGKSGDAFWMRSELGNGLDASNPGCSFSDGISTQAIAAVYYQNADTNSSPNTTASWTTAQLQHCGNDDLSETTAYCAVTPEVVPGTVETVDITFGSNGTNFVWFMNNSTFRADYNHALLSAVNKGNLTFEEEWNVFNFGSNSSVRLVLQNFFFVAHPIHLHGHNFHVLNEGVGTWDGTVINPSNTQMRDVQLMQPGKSSNGTITPSYIVLQWTQDNPSVWPLHCHIAWHVSGGLYINVLERPDDIQKLTIPASIDQTAADWDAFTSDHTVDEIDSGL